MQSFHFTVNISPNVDPWNEDYDLVIDINATDAMTLSAIHTYVLKSLELKKSSKLYYFSSNGRILDMDKPLHFLGIGENSEITLDRTRHRERFERDCPVRTSENAINIFCVSRVGAVEGSLIRTKVIVSVVDDCADMMEEIAHRWGKSHLKFKYGRTILKAGKTFEEQGIENGCEIVVTGGRG